MRIERKEEETEKVADLYEVISPFPSTGIETDLTRGLRRDW